ncbi:hypothetical protein [Shewanella youngdeokensis]|uniref:Pyrrolidone-carboxylate peptidase n=1 Tax=Shewanella youngdeokensis TaxID=2999068 RepID=A0ABZ0JZK4_9GAMM|nr:hypothetical protein RGE70_01845 [Shewanella sp. DAU334]
MKTPSMALITSTLLMGLFSHSAIAQLDVEEARLPTAIEAMPNVVNRYQPLIADVSKQYAQQSDELNITQMIAAQGLRLWQRAVNDVQTGHIDDRALYWSRLAIRDVLKTQQPNFNMSAWQRDVLITAIEKNSRGLSDVKFNDDAHIKILLTGFDPFFLDRHIDQSNPSGLVALALDGYRFKVNGKQVQIETAMIPVRFADFDNGLIESLLTPIYRDNSADMIFTVSMGRDQFDIERFPGRNRSAAAPDNLNVLTGANKQAPIAPLFNGSALKGPEFVEFSLPIAAMQTAKGPWQINDNHTVSTLAKGEFQATSLSQLQNATSVEGSGGGYLSNEISYRAILLQNNFNSRIPVGHIHTPRIAAYNEQVERDIVEQVKAMVKKAAATL